MWLSATPNSCCPAGIGSIVQFTPSSFWPLRLPLEIRRGNCTGTWISPMQIRANVSPCKPLLRRHSGESNRARTLSMKEFIDLHCASGLRSEEHTSELQSQSNLVCRLLLEKK